MTNLSRVYTYGFDLISQRSPGSSNNFLGVDGLGSTRLLMNMAGGIANAFAYDAFGTLIASNGPVQTECLFTGEQRDGDLGGLYYLRDRYDDPNLGRFLNADTFEGWKRRPKSLHRYLYHDPINFVDPSGHSGDLSLPGFNVAGAIAIGLGGLAAYTVAEFTRRSGPVSLPSIDWTPAKVETQPEPQPQRKPRDGGDPPPPIPPKEDDSEDLLYRGVPRTREDDYRSALLGVAKPRGTRLDFDALRRHVENDPNIKTGVTSWSTVRAVARRHSGSDGVILEIDLFTVADRIVPRPPVGRFLDEHEVLLKGVISGARPTRP